MVSSGVGKIFWSLENIFNFDVGGGHMGVLLLLFSHPVVSDSLQPHGLQHARLLCLYYLPELAQVHVYCISDDI